VTKMQTSILLVPLGVLAAAAQLIATRWGLAGEIAGGFLCGVLIVAGMRLLAPDGENLWLPALVAAAASVAGLIPGIAGPGVAPSHVAWAAPLLAALLPGGLALRAALRGRKCQLCGTPLRRLLSFSCPRCHLTACENCWQFERNRCRLCEANQVALFPLDVSWWQERFGTQVHGGRCALCLSAADGKVAQWACAGCGHSQCRLCWDDNNGQCSRCAWTVPDLPEEIGAYLAAGGRQGKVSR
jgi:hypothetical protein